MFLVDPVLRPLTDPKIFPLLFDLQTAGLDVKDTKNLKPIMSRALADCLLWQLRLEKAVQRDPLYQREWFRRVSVPSRLPLRSIIQALPDGRKLISRACVGAALAEPMPAGWNVKLL